MGVGATELLVILVVLTVLVVPTIYGAYRAFTAGDTGWGVAIVAGGILGFGWLIGLIYLASAARRPR